MKQKVGIFLISIFLNQLYALNKPKYLTQSTVEVTGFSAEVPIVGEVTSIYNEICSDSVQLLSNSQIELTFPPANHQYLDDGYSNTIPMILEETVAATLQVENKVYEATLASFTTDGNDDQTVIFEFSNKAVDVGECFTLTVSNVRMQYTVVEQGQTREAIDIVIQTKDGDTYFILNSNVGPWFAQSFGNVQQVSQYNANTLQFDLKVPLPVYDQVDFRLVLFQENLNMDDLSYECITNCDSTAVFNDNQYDHGTAFEMRSFIPFEISSGTFIIFRISGFNDFDLSSRNAFYYQLVLNKEPILEGQASLGEQSDTIELEDIILECKACHSVFDVCLSFWSQILTASIFGSEILCHLQFTPTFVLKQTDTITIEFQQSLGVAQHEDPIYFQVCDSSTDTDNEFINYYSETSISDDKQTMTLPNLYVAQQNMAYDIDENVFTPIDIYVGYVNYPNLLELILKFVQRSTITITDEDGTIMVDQRVQGLAF